MSTEGGEGVPEESWRAFGRNVALIVPPSVPAAHGAVGVRGTTGRINRRESRPRSFFKRKTQSPSPVLWARQPKAESRLLRTCSSTLRLLDADRRDYLRPA